MTRMVYLDVGEPDPLLSRFKVRLVLMLSEPNIEDNESGRYP